MQGHPEHDGSYMLQQLDTNWASTKSHWRDDMATDFDARHWMPLFKESRSYLEALSELMELLEAAERDTEY